MTSAFRNSRLVKWYLRILERHPTKTMCLTTATLHAVGDVIAQKFIEKKEQLEIVRTGRFFVIGLAWDGPLLSWWYRALSRMIPVASKSATVLKVALDQGVFIPGMLASFLVLNAALKGMDSEDISTILKRDYFHLLLANYQLWPLAMTFNFYLMPVKHQVLFTNSVSLAWNTYLSWRANQELLKSLQIAAEEQTQMSTSEANDDNDNNYVIYNIDFNNNIDIEGSEAVSTGDRKRTSAKRDIDEDEKDSIVKEETRVAHIVEVAQKVELAQQVGKVTRRWNVDFLSHPYALLPR